MAKKWTKYMNFGNMQAIFLHLHSWIYRNPYERFKYLQLIRWSYICMCSNKHFVLPLIALISKVSLTFHFLDYHHQGQIQDLSLGGVNWIECRAKQGKKYYGVKFVVKNVFLTDWGGGVRPVRQSLDLCLIICQISW